MKKYYFLLGIGAILLLAGCNPQSNNTANKQFLEKVQQLKNKSNQVYKQWVEKAQKIKKQTLENINKKEQQVKDWIKKSAKEIVNNILDSVLKTN